MSLWGVGPLLAVIGGLAFVLVFLLQRIFGLSALLAEPYLAWVRLLGLGWGAIGLWFYIGSAVLVTLGYRRRELVTRGVYRYSRNPMYAAFIVFLIPALSFVSGDLMILLVSAVLFVAFKVLIRREEAFLTQEFGKRYVQYAERVPQFIPFVRV
ncbi:MAG TPA: isoprenylcysteine carboxylmethyltransferase family protein [bacterium]|nr:isoprenylcysteine carboxylmethyltransferase family protein [bacterium]